MSWFKQVGRWRGSAQPEEKVSTGTTSRHLLATSTAYQADH